MRDQDSAIGFDSRAVLRVMQNLRHQFPADAKALDDYHAWLTKGIVRLSQQDGAQGGEAVAFAELPEIESSAEFMRQCKLQWQRVVDEHPDLGSGAARASARKRAAHFANAEAALSRPAIAPQATDPAMCSHYFPMDPRRCVRCGWDFRQGDPPQATPAAVKVQWPDADFSGTAKAARWNAARAACIGAYHAALAAPPAEVKP